MAHGETPCNQCSSTALFALTAGSSPLVNGSYAVQVGFDKGHGVTATDSSTFSVGSPVSSGAISAMALSIVALALLFSKKAKRP